MRPLTKNADNEQYFEYSPSSAFLPSVALGTLLTTNQVVVLRDGGRGKAQRENLGKLGSIVNLGSGCALQINDDSALP